MALFLYPNGGDNMGQTVSFDYFYGGQSDAFSYYRIPRLLITGHQFKGLSTDAKLLYGLLLDRMGLSSRNGWYDDLGRVYGCAPYSAGWSRARRSLPCIPDWCTGCRGRNEGSAPSGNHSVKPHCAGHRRTGRHAYLASSLAQRRMVAAWH